MNQNRIRQHYTKEFKSDVVKLVLEHGHSANEVARRLGINQTNVSFPVVFVNTARTTNQLLKAVLPAASWKPRSRTCVKKNSA